MNVSGSGGAAVAAPLLAPFTTAADAMPAAVALALPPNAADSVAGVVAVLPSAAGPAGDADRAAEWTGAAAAVGSQRWGLNRSTSEP